MQSGFFVLAFSLLGLVVAPPLFGGAAAVPLVVLIALGAGVLFGVAAAVLMLFQAVIDRDE